MNIEDFRKKLEDKTLQEVTQMIGNYTWNFQHGLIHYVEYIAIIEELSKALDKFRIIEVM